MIAQKNIAVDITYDMTYVCSVLFQPEILAALKDDACDMPIDQMRNTVLHGLPGFFLKAQVDGEDAGLWWLVWRGNSVEAHTALLPNCRGACAIEATKQAIRWVFLHTEAQAIVSYSWGDSPAVKWFCRKVGMHQQETLPWHTTRNGEPVSITYFSINREEII